MHLSDFDYTLPDRLIARYPTRQRRASRLLIVDCAADRLVDRRFGDLPAFLRRGDLLVFNDTKVIKARLHGYKDSGGKIELLVERITAVHTCLALVRARKAPKPGPQLLFAVE